MLLNPTCRRFISVYLNLAELCMEKHHVDDFPGTRWNHFSIILLLSTSHNMLHFHSFSVFAKTLFMFCTRSNNGSTVEVAHISIYTTNRKSLKTTSHFVPNDDYTKSHIFCIFELPFLYGKRHHLFICFEDIPCFLVLKLLWYSMTQFN